jgi:hypothetical protein
MFGLLTSLAMFACSGDKTTDTSSVSDTATEEGCGIELDDTYPVLNASDVYYLANLTVELNDPDETATLTLVDGSGAEVAGAVTVDDDTLTFDPTDSLLPSTAYTLNVSYCAGEAAIDFTTSALGTDIEGGNDVIVGQTYALDISSGTFVEPAGVGDLIGGLLENNILIGITSVEDSEMNIRGAISVAATTDQDFCTETLEEFPAADFTTAPYFEIPKEDVTLSVAGFTATIYGLAVTGTFAADGTYFGGATLEGELDARQILPLLGDAGLDAETPEEVCGLLLGFGVLCVECQSDSEPLCVALVVERLTADATGVELGVVCDAECHEECTENNAETCTEPQAADLGECAAE